MIRFTQRKFFMVKTKLSIPPGKTDLETIYYIIDEVIKKIVKKSTFGYFTQDDLKQEAWIIAIKAVQSPKYDETRPLEKFLYRHIKNRLTNFRRDNYHRQTTKNMRKKVLMDPAPQNTGDRESNSDFIQDILSNELEQFVKDNMTASMYESYLDMRDGISIDNEIELSIKKNLLMIMELYNG